MTKLILYTTEKCGPCTSMKTALDALGAEYTEVKLKNGMVLPRDVRSIPTLAIEKDGKRTTVCTGWPGSLRALKKILQTCGITTKGEEK